VAIVSWRRPWLWFTWHLRNVGIFLGDHLAKSTQQVNSTRFGLPGPPAPTNEFDLRWQIAAHPGNREGGDGYQLVRLLW
jgi:hypothetical protein